MNFSDYSYGLLCGNNIATKRDFCFFPAMERKKVVAIVAGIGFVAAMFALSQVRSYSCGDFKRIQYEYAVKLKPLQEKVETLNDPSSCKIAKDEILPILGQYKDDLDWFENCWWGKEDIRDFRDRFDKLNREINDEFQTSCAPLGM